ncbi:MAG: ATP-grasp domain-containing protein [Saprospiraceae bacterium]
MSKVSFLCIASYFKGEDFLKAAKQAGCTVCLLTSKKHDCKPWPWESIDDTFYVQDDGHDNWKMDDVIAGLSFVMRTRKIDRIIALDDFDVEKGALLRETFRIPGMGQTTGRFFRDKLAMRIQAADAGINVPSFSALFNDEEINAYIAKTSAPWLVKPRGEASATGIQKAHSAEQLWQIINSLGEKRHQYLVEQFRPGDVYHVDSLSFDREVVFVRVSRYLSTPMDVAHGGGIFRSVVVKFGSKDDKALQKMNQEVMDAFGMNYSASHTEFIKSREDGKYYFLETASRVGGANLAEMVEISSGINLWAEWAKLEAAVVKGEQYKVPEPRMDYAGIIVSLSRHQWPDSSGFTDKEICWRMKKEYHIGMIVKAQKEEKVIELLEGYAETIKSDFHASLPISNKHAS